MELCVLLDFLCYLVRTNLRVFEDKFDDVDYLWNEVCYLSSVWTLVFPPFKGIPLLMISRV